MFSNSNKHIQMKETLKGIKNEETSIEDDFEKSCRKLQFSFRVCVCVWVPIGIHFVCAFDVAGYNHDPLLIFHITGNALCIKNAIKCEQYYIKWNGCVSLIMCTICGIPGAGICEWRDREDVEYCIVAKSSQVKRGRRGGPYVPRDKKTLHQN